MPASWRFWGRLASSGPATLTSPRHFRTGNPTVLWADSANGSDSNTGKQKEEPLLTIEAALAAALNGTLIILKPGFSQTMASGLPLSLIGVRICGEGEGQQQARLLGTDAAGLFAVSGMVDFENIKFPESLVSLTQSRIRAVSGGQARLFDCAFECGTLDVRHALHNAASRMIVKGCTMLSTSGHPLGALLMEDGFTEIDDTSIDGGVFGWEDDGSGHQVAVEANEGWLDMHDCVLRGHSDVYIHAETATTVAQARVEEVNDVGEDCSILYEDAEPPPES